MSSFYVKCLVGIRLLLVILLEGQKRSVKIMLIGLYYYITNKIPAKCFKISEGNKNGSSSKYSRYLGHCLLKRVLDIAGPYLMTTQDVILDSCMKSYSYVT